MNYLLRPRIWPSSLASSGVGPCDVPLQVRLGTNPAGRGTVARWHAHLCALAAAIHGISRLEHLSKHKVVLEWLRIIVLAISKVAQSNLAQDMLTISEMNSVLSLIFHKVEFPVRRAKRSYPLSQSRQGVNL
jgi:hypothetical protein